MLDEDLSDGTDVLVESDRVVEGEVVCNSLWQYSQQGGEGVLLQLGRCKSWAGLGGVLSDILHGGGEVVLVCYVLELGEGDPCPLRQLDGLCDKGT